MTKAMSEAKRKNWADGKYARRKTWKGGHRRKNPPEAIKRFEVLVMAVIALEIVDWSTNSNSAINSCVMLVRKYMTTALTAWSSVSSRGRSRP